MYINGQPNNTDSVFAPYTGFHWLEIGAHIAGQATLNDMSTEFRAEPVSAKAGDLGAYKNTDVDRKPPLSVRPPRTFAYKDYK